ncbi:MAG: hypothetical protein H8E21_12690 [Gammaproteobacteria bacterium]|nr:hypothetical protein [Gammaproteobacteria bacterium]
MCVKYLFSLLLLVPVIMPVYAQEDEDRIRYSYDLSTVYDDNIRRAKYDADIREDSLFNLSFRAHKKLWNSRFSQLGIAAKVEAEKYSTFDTLDNVGFGVGLKYSFSFSSGFSAPLYSLKLDLGGIKSESEMRTADTASLGLEINKWLTNTISLTAGYKAKLQDSQSEVFDTMEHQFFANLDLELSARHLFYLTYHYIAGDIVSSATPKIAIINAADAIEPDDAFGGIAANQFAYRLDAVSQVVTLGYNAAISGNLSLDLSLRYINSEATQDPFIYYDRTIVRASLVGRF